MSSFSLYFFFCEGWNLWRRREGEAVRGRRTGSGKGETMVEELGCVMGGEKGGLGHLLRLPRLMGCMASCYHVIVGSSEIIMFFFICGTAMFGGFFRPEAFSSSVLEISPTDIWPGKTLQALPN